MPVKSVSSPNSVCIEPPDDELMTNQDFEEKRKPVK